MIKIAVFGFFGEDQTRIVPSENNHLSPVSTDEFMRAVGAMEPGTAADRRGAAPCFVKLNTVASQPVYVQSLSDRMAPGAGLFNCDGYVAIIDAVKILAPNTIRRTLHRLSTLHPEAHLIVAAGRQNEPEALSSDEIRDVLGLHHELPVYPYALEEPKTVRRLVKRLARYIDDPARVPVPIFAGMPVAETQPAQTAVRGNVLTAEPDASPAPPAPQIHGLAQVTLTVRDLERALDFYRGLLGFRLRGQIDMPDSDPPLTITHLDVGNGVLALKSYAKVSVDDSPDAPSHAPAGPGMALRVTGLDAIAEQLICAGVDVVYEPREQPGGIRSMLVRDPDGTPVELFEGEPVYTRR